MSGDLAWTEVTVLIPVPDTQLLTVSVVSLGQLVEGLAGGASLEEAVDDAAFDGTNWSSPERMGPELVGLAQRIQKANAGLAYWEGS